jgi:signal transduction histidine kinase
VTPPNSLWFRLVASSAIISLVLLAAAGFLLNGLFQQALERNFDARLTAVLDGLLANVALDEQGRPKIETELADTRFALPLSGWYWQVMPVKQGAAGQLLSESLGEVPLVPKPSDLTNRDAQTVAHFYMDDTNGTQLRVLEQRFTLFGGADEYSFLVAGNYDELKNEAEAFRNTLLAVLTVLGLGLLLAIFVQMRFGLRPLAEMQERLTAIREGKASRMEGVYPAEIQPVAGELNLLLQSNIEIVERARTQVGNLAHALKTPLSVLANEAKLQPGALADKVGEQTQVMRDQVSLYLDRARRAARAQTLGAITEVEPVLAALARTLERIHQERAIKVTVQCVPGLKFRGEKQDLEEMAGNLMDNACKYAIREVTVEARPAKGEEDDGRLWLDLAVGDDGPGIAPEKWTTALKRGQRLDESKPGSGLGLSIVVETAAMYSGSVKLGVARAGGLLATLRLPAIP